MLLPMWKAAIALACLAGEGATRRVHTSFDPISAFNPATRSPAALDKPIRLSHRSPEMLLHDQHISDADEADESGRVTRRAALAGALGAALLTGQAATAEETPPKFVRLSPIQYIAALGDPKASSGTGADKWGLWEEDPGPNGVFLKDYEKRIAARNGKALAGWMFDPKSWWVEEHGLIMPTPDKLPLISYEPGKTEPLKRYVVTGGRDVTTILTVRKDGTWQLEKGTLYDVTHLPCRSAIYTSAVEGGSCMPQKDMMKAFPVKPGGKMPKFDGCNTQDWAVLFVVGEEA